MRGIELARAGPVFSAFNPIQSRLFCRLKVQEGH